MTPPSETPSRTQPTTLSQVQDPLAAAPSSRSNRRMGAPPTREPAPEGPAVVPTAPLRELAILPDTEHVITPAIVETTIDFLLRHGGS